MRPLALSHARSVTRPLSTLKNTPTQSAQAAPVVRFRPLNPAASAWSGTSRASYYFDASRQTIKTLKILLANTNSTKADSTENFLSSQDHSQLLAKTMKNLLFSLRPGLQDEATSHAHFLTLLRTHFSGLNAAELASLSQSLKSARFFCQVTEAFIDDDIYLKFGCTSTNTSPHLSDRTILNTTKLYDLLDELHQTALRNEANEPAVSMLSPSAAQSARDVLADCATHWQSSDKSLRQIHEVACRLADALALPIRPATTVAHRQPSRASMVGWQDGQLQIEPMIAAQLSQDEQGTLFVRVMRDMLELLMTKKLFGPQAMPQQLTSLQHCRMQEALEQVTEQCAPRGHSTTLRTLAQAVLKQSASFGEIQILPSAGAAIGHAWISPTLSLMPDRTMRSKEIGTRFMQTGMDLVPREKVVREWSPRFLNADDNEAMYPSADAWHLPVPANAAQLQIAAQAVGNEWLERGVPYRFTGTTPVMEATGCRMAVWQAVTRSLEPDARALFDHYNRGLPEPDSPTELWQRLDGLMQWMQQRAKAD